MIRVLKILTVSLVFAFCFAAATANAQTPFEGYCFASDDCGGPYEITGIGYDTCEMRCTMSNPVDVRGMDGVLYDVSCSGDGFSTEYRLFMAKFPGTDLVIAYSEITGPEVLRKC